MSTFAALFGPGCDAVFVDGRNVAAIGDGGPASVGAAGPIEGGTVLESASFSGVAGHYGSGVGRIVQVDSEFYVELAEDFDSTPVPSAVLVLSPRADLGIRIDPSLGDIEVARLHASSGAQHYPLRASDAALRYVHVYCDAFGVGVAQGDFEVAP